MHVYIIEGVKKSRLMGQADGVCPIGGVLLPRVKRLIKYALLRNIDYN